MSEQQVFEPLPCPFCGSHNVKPYEYLSGVEDAFCQCADCGSMGPSGKHATKDSAVAEWNQRAALPRPAPQGVAEPSKPDAGKAAALYATLYHDTKARVAELEGTLLSVMDSAEEWSGYVEVDHAPMSLVKHLERAIASAKEPK